MLVLLWIDGRRSGRGRVTTDTAAVAIGPDRRVWVTAFWSSEMWALDPKDGAIEKFEVNSTPNVVAHVRALEFASDGRLYLWNVTGQATA